MTSCSCIFRAVMPIEVEVQMLSLFQEDLTSGAGLSRISFTGICLASTHRVAEQSRLVEHLDDTCSVISR